MILLLPRTITIGRENEEQKQSEIAALQYRFGVQRNPGILLEAVCATETETFARVFIPEDDIDAQYRLIGRGLKLSCPVERYRMSAVTNPVHWLFLRLRYRKRSKMLEPNQKP